MCLVLACGITALLIGIFCDILLTCAIVINSIRKIDYSSLYEKNDAEFDDDSDDENDESDMTQE